MLSRKVERLCVKEVFMTTDVRVREAVQAPPVDSFLGAPFLKQG